MRRAWSFPPPQGVTPSRVGEATLLAVEPTRLEMGTVDSGGNAEVSFQLRNPTPSEVEVATFQTSCDCFRVELSKPILSPNESITATASLNLADKPRFVGRLCLDARGRTADGKLAFAVEADVTVRETPR